MGGMGWEAHDGELGRRLAGLPQCPLLVTLGELAAGLGMEACLVGGGVRDLLLGRLAPDCDVVVAGEAGRLAAALAAVYPGAWLRQHRAMGTVTLAVPGPDGGWLGLDLATARREFYPAPAAMPVVTPAGLVEDLGRRDFTINAMALGVTPATWGRLLDPWGGRADLRRGWLRVLHADSFIDDPTRLLRGVRLAHTLSLGWENGSAELAARAIAARAPARLSGVRLWGELRRLLLLPDPGPVGWGLAEWGFWQALRQPLPWDAQVARGVARPLGELGWEPRLLAWLLAMEAGAARRLVTECGLPRGRARALLAARALLRDWPAGEWALYRRLAELGAVGETVAAWWLPAGQAARLAALMGLQSQQPVRVTGEDLLSLGVAPGPARRALLDEVGRQALEAGLRGREAQLAWLRERVHGVAGLTCA